MENELQQKNSNTSLDNFWANADAFNLAVRMAQALSKSTIVPREYQGDIGVGNCMIALEMANRLKTSPLMVMQNLYIVNGKPAWSSQYIIAMINNSNRYKTEIQFKIEGTGDDRSCIAFAVAHDGRVVEGPKISIALARSEGWLNKNGSKWKTMPDVMLRYRAASFFGRVNCPDLIMGMYTVEEEKELQSETKTPERKPVKPVEKTALTLKEKIFNNKADENQEEIVEEPIKEEPKQVDVKKATREQKTKVQEVIQEDLGLEMVGNKQPNFQREEGMSYDDEEDYPF